jgi:hypothetical protein
VTPPSVAVYEDRLRKRGTDTEERLLAKVAQAADEMSAATVNGPNRKFDYVLVNEEIDMAVEELIFTLQGWYTEIENFNPALPASPAPGTANSSSLPAFSQPQSPARVSHK